MYIPAQDFPKQHFDLRCLAAPVQRGVKIGPSSTCNTSQTQPAVKRKREDASELHSVGQDAVLTCPSPNTKRVRLVSTARNTVGLGNGKPWKQAAERRTSASRAGCSSKSWAQKMKEKQDHHISRQRSADAREAYKAEQRSRRIALEAAKQRRESQRKANDRAQGQVVSSATARKMMKSKKLRKQLVTG